MRNVRRGAGARLHHGLGAGLAGALPPSLGDLGLSLTDLYLNYNAITSLPTEIGALTGLEVLKMTGNAITSVPSELGALTNLKLLSLSNNKLTSLPTELGDLAGLKGLFLQNNELTSLPAEIAALAGLTALYLNSNQLTGVPEEFQTFAPSSYCDLSDNDPDFSCANVGFGTRCCTSDNCGDTSTCHGSNCSYADTTCAAGTICPGGTAVTAECADRSAFAENPCACTALQQLAALSPSLQTVAPWDDLSNGPSCQAGLPDQAFQVYCATVDGVQLPMIVFSGYLGSGAGLTGALPPSLGDLGPSLTYLPLYAEAITSVPPEIGALTSLEVLGLGGNSITAVPAEIGALTSLTELDLNDNALTSLPTELGALTVLRYLDLSNNQLTGVPAEFRTVSPSEGCFLLSNDLGFSCANIGFGTECCNQDNCGITATTPTDTTCYQG